MYHLEEMSTLRWMLVSGSAHPIKQELQLVIAAVDASIGQQADEVEGALGGCRCNVLPAIHLKQLPRLKGFVYQPGSLIHLPMKMIKMASVELLKSTLLWACMA